MIIFRERAANSLCTVTAHFGLGSRSRPGVLRLAGFLGIFLLTMAICPGANAVQSAFLSWNASTDPTVIGYNIYYGGESGVYTNEISVSNVTSAVIPGLVEGATYYFVVTAYDSFDDESLFSNEAGYLVPSSGSSNPPPPPGAKLQLNPITGGGFTLTGQGISGHTYQVEMTSDLTTWTTISIQTAGPDGTFQFTDLSAAYSPMRFYRTLETQ